MIAVGIFLKRVNFVVEKPRGFCPGVGNQRLCLGKFELEFLLQEGSEALLDFLRFLLWANKSQSGKEAASLRLPPLETVHAPLSAHSLSTSRTTRLLVLLLPCLSRRALFFCQQVSVVELLAIAHASFCYGVNMLMAEQVNQCQIAVDIFAPKRFCQAVMNLDF